MIEQMESEQKDDMALKGAMAAWRADVATPPDFRAAVWRRIRQRQELREGRWLWFAEAAHWLLGDMRLAAALPVLAVAAGFVLGQWHDRKSAWDAQKHLQVAYAESLDPYAIAARHLEGP
jgi:hypothetical protein